MNPINDNAQLTMLLSMFVGQLPILIVSLLGCVVIAARRNELAGASAWALMGFGLSVILCVVIPVAQTLVQKWALEGGASMVQRASVLTVLAIVWSLFRAASYASLLMAVVAGRKRTEA